MKSELIRRVVLCVIAVGLAGLVVWETVLAVRNYLKENSSN
jgi:hypothetical protein